MKKQVRDLKKGDVLVWGGSIGGAKVTTDYVEGQRVQIEWDTDEKTYTATLAWTPDYVANLISSVTSRWTALRRYVQLVNSEIYHRSPGQWGDIDYPGNTDHADDPRDIRGGVEALPFALVERSSYGQTWITLHETADDAVSYHEGQEYAEDWRVDDLIDICNGQHYRLSARAVPT
jgi:hypothetical protein